MNNDDIHTPEQEPIRIHACHEAELDKKIAKLNGKADRFGAGDVRITKTPVTETRNVLNPITRKYHKVSYPMIELTVTGDVIKVAGYDFICRVDFEAEGNIIAAAPGKDVPVWARTTGSDRCDHCGHSRHRSNVWLLEKDGEHIQVGSSCLKDFLGHDPKRIISLFSWLSSVRMMRDGMDGGESKTGGGSMFQHPAADPIHLLSVTSAVIRKNGWVSRAAAKMSDVDSTSDQVIRYIWPSSKWDWQDRRDIGEPTDDDTATAVEVMEYLREMCERPDKSDYEHNLCVIYNIGLIPIKRFGLFCSAVQAYRRHAGYIERRNDRERQERNSTHVGIVGQRITFSATVEHIQHLSNDYGAVTLITFADPAGNTLKWFASRYIDEYDKSERVTVTGTVRRHDEYRGRDETLLTRCTIDRVGTTGGALQRAMEERTQ